MKIKLEFEWIQVLKGEGKKLSKTKVDLAAQLILVWEKTIWNEERREIVEFGRNWGELALLKQLEIVLHCNLELV